MRPGGTLRNPRVRVKPITVGGLTELTTVTTLCSKRVSILRILTQCIFCIAALILGFRVSYEANLVRVLDVEETSRQNSQVPIQRVHESNLRVFKSQNARLTPRGKSSQVYVGRHPILKRPWPHPDPIEMAQAYNMLARVQLEQQRLYGIENWKPIIAITPTYFRTFQSLHLSGLMHTLSLVRRPVTWIVIEASGISAETAELLRQVRVHKLVHLGASEHLPRTLQDRIILEARLRTEGLRYVREQNLEGVIVFADESNVYSMQFFDEVQKVKWVGALPVGTLGYAGFEDPALLRDKGFLKDSGARLFRRRLLEPLQEMPVSRNTVLQVQGPTCDSSENITGWRAFRPLSLDDVLINEYRDEQTNLEWSGFVLNARTVWASAPDRPKWIREWVEWARPEQRRYIDPRSLLSDETKVETLGSCGNGKAVLVWWARIEARSDSKYPPRWNLDLPLEVVVPARKTPWPEKIFPLSYPPPYVGKRKVGNRSGGRGGRSRRGKRQPDSKISALVNQREVNATKGTAMGTSVDKRTRFRKCD
ncbi:probable beta-1,4-xylosyltransferase IRX14H isoform X1 [Physcomitrium patens]|uniref:Glycosyltransferases n=2 Tax=Physcomitrium patens TaxID=3218 RepID=A0A7I4AVX5_PHYPA|nr:probable beta-1,4-xylosyltransferase IRX14H isoform X1 [Physcomitrium patens]XP_024395815.1 probable beta-1,4-xylosyltransferase IRX14H isoform X1 [Physcomitrium patens]XP_024395816.1 probable beta-1,4-xylosyltransferase IRX14H isoform X1 [Physcomitrium patens]XP_024395817.1 probable beta-1,4-xylosyltransferase IRX14H isoform X1 [Physcomitrium patens]|eukprot:XP_024395814.1 probable beta-1,4-xylosyltransferase IRX14H isoform X1 [Physcomitrella patens]